MLAAVGVAVLGMLLLASLPCIPGAWTPPSGGGTAMVLCPDPVWSWLFGFFAGILPIVAGAVLALRDWRAARSRTVKPG